MKLDDVFRLKRSLEETFDIPFDVRKSYHYQDPLYTIIPQNDLEELFCISIHVRQGIRLIIEIEPQKYGAGFVSEAGHANEEKRKNFLSYYEIIGDKKAKIELIVNKFPCDPQDDTVWQTEWVQLRIRITKIIGEELGEDKNELELIVDWALISTGLILSLSLIHISEPEEKQYEEGKKTQVLINRYERNPVNREICLAKNGYSCKICGFNFEATYGEIGKKFIHVHHIETVSSHGGQYLLDPATDLIPVCPNCHAMLHRKDPPFLPGEIEEVLLQRRRDE